MTQVLKFKKTEDLKCWQGCGTGELLSYIAGGNATWYSHFGETVNFLYIETYIPVISFLCIQEK